MLVGVFNTPQGNQPEMLAAAQAAAYGINQAGGVHGRPLDIISCNGMQEANATTQCVQQGISDGVASFVSSWFLPSEDTSMQLLKNANIPSIGSLPTAPSELTTSISYPTGGGTTTGFPALGYLLKQGYPNLTKVTAASYDVAAAHDSAALVEAGVQQAGLQWISGPFIPYTATDYAPYAQALKNSGAQVVVNVLSEQGAINLIQACLAIGYDPIFSAPDNTVHPTNFASLGGNVESNMLLTSQQAVPPGNTSVPGVQMMNQDLENAGAHGIANTQLTLESGYSTGAWLAVKEFANVADTITGTINGASVIKALNSAKDLPVYGLLPNTWTPSATFNSTVPRISNPYVYLEKIVNGAIVTTGQPINIFSLGFKPPNLAASS
jgi:ABC-type branched-subunit amino acid transport system substrate-binding protein